MKRVKTKWIIRIDGTTKVLVETGQKVAAGKLLATSEQRITTSHKIPKVHEWKAKWIGKEVKKGELLWKSRGWWGIKIFSSAEGRIVSVDELQNVVVETVLPKRREILSPAEAVVAKVEKDKIVLEFKAVEFRGKGVVRGKAWGEIGKEEVEKMSDLTSELDGKILLVPKLDAVLLAKAEVVGVAGVLTKEGGGQVGRGGGVPVLGVGEKDWRDLKKMLGSEGGLRAMINSLKDRLLVVVN